MYDVWIKRHAKGDHTAFLYTILVTMDCNTSDVLNEWNAKEVLKYATAVSFKMQRNRWERMVKSWLTSIQLYLCLSYWVTVISTFWNT